MYILNLNFSQMLLSNLYFVMDVPFSFMNINHISFAFVHINSLEKNCEFRIQR